MRVKNRKVVLVSALFNAGVAATTTQQIDIPFKVDEMIVKQAQYDDTNDNSFYYIACDLTRDKFITMVKDSGVIPITNLDVHHMLDREVKGDVTFTVFSATPNITTNVTAMALLLEFVQYDK